MSNPPATYQMDIRVSIRGTSAYSSGGSLDVTETLTVDVAGFMEIAAVLGQFHELAEQIRAKQQQRVAERTPRGWPE